MTNSIFTINFAARVAAVLNSSDFTFETNGSNGGKDAEKAAAVLTRARFAPSMVLKNLIEVGEALTEEIDEVTPIAAAERIADLSARCRIPGSFGWKLAEDLSFIIEPDFSETY